MISKSSFIDIIKDYKEFNKKVDKLSDFLKVDIYESDIIEHQGIQFDKFMKILFNDDALDTIYWWLYEKSIHPNEQMLNNKGEVIPTDTVEDLWEIIKDNRI